MKSRSVQRSFWKKCVFEILVAFSIAVIGIAFYQLSTEIRERQVDNDTPTEVAQVPTYKYGFDMSSHIFEKLKVAPNQFIGDILSDNGVSYQTIAELEQAANDVFSVRKIKAGKYLTLVRSDSCGGVDCMIYEPDPFRYVKYNLEEDVDVKVVDRAYTTCVDIASGTVESSLWNAMKDQGLSASLIDRMEDALAWSIDFYHTQKNDQYKLIFEQKYIDGKAVGIGQLLGAYYKNFDNEYYAVYYENDKYKGFYDLEGRPTKKAFLKAPVKFSRISSRFSYSRFHPIKKRRIPHLGTDYAAPYGTPIRAVGNGVVVAASYAQGNGRYVKIKHDEVYQTQYLHMQRFAKGIRRGVHVKQGQTIGYVGSTGLATGPHVCFRFWKNGRQVNHMRENFPPPDPMAEADLPDFYRVRDDIVRQLDAVPSASPASDIYAETMTSENNRRINP